MWERELRKIKGLFDNRLRASQMKSSKMEQALTNQTYQVKNKENFIDQCNINGFMGLRLWKYVTYAMIGSPLLVINFDLKS